MKSVFWFFLTWFCISAVITAGLAIAAINIDTGEWPLLGLGILMFVVGVVMALEEKHKLEQGED